MRTNRLVLPALPSRVARRDTIIEHGKLIGAIGCSEVPIRGIGLSAGQAHPSLNSAE
jgi:hypothetical protein